MGAIAEWKRQRKESGTGQQNYREYLICTTARPQTGKVNIASETCDPTKNLTHPLLSPRGEEKEWGWGKRVLEVEWAKLFRFGKRTTKQQVQEAK